MFGRGINYTEKETTYITNKKMKKIIMTDQTRWGIPETQQKNKMKGREDLDLTLQIKKLKEEIESLKSELAREKEDHQYDNLVHQQEVKEKIK